MPRGRSSPPLEDALEADDAVVAREADQRQREQDDRQRGGERPVERDLHLALDQHGDHHVAGAADERRRDEEAQAQDEHEQCPAGDAGQRERQEHTAEGLEAARSQAMRRADKAGIDPLHHAVHRQHHVGQQHVAHADHHAGLVVEERQGRIGAGPAPSGTGSRCRFARGGPSRHRCAR